MKTLTNITEKQISDNGVQALATRPNLPSQYGLAGLSSEGLKKWFDNLSKLLAGKINEIQGAIQDPGYIGLGEYSLEIKDENVTVNIDDLQGLIESFTDGNFAKILKVEGFVADNLSRFNSLQAVIDQICGDISGLELRLTKNDNKIELSIIYGNGEELSETIEIDLSVDTNKIKDQAVTNAKIADSAVSSEKIQSDAVSSEKIQSDAVTTDKIAYEAVTEDKIALRAVGHYKIQEGAVRTSNILRHAVTTDKIADQAVTEDKIAEDAVTSKKIKDGAVSEDKIGYGAVTYDKIGKSAIGLHHLSNDAAKAFKSVSYDSAKGILTFTSLHGQTQEIDLPLERLLSSAGSYFDDETNDIVLKLANGEEIKISVEKISENIITAINKTLEDISKKYDYHKKISFYEYKEGYIAFDLQGGAMVDILVDYLLDVETYHKTLFRITCSQSATHDHTLTVDAGEKYPKHYTEEWDYPIGSSTWYIPITFTEDGYNGPNTVDIYAKSVMDAIDYDLNVRFVETLPDDAEPISPTSYATKEDIGDISAALDELHTYAQNLIGGNS